MNHVIINSMSDLPKFDPSMPIFSDLETDDLYGPIRMIQVYQPSTDPTVYIVDIAPIGYNKDKYTEELLAMEDFVMDNYTVWFNGSYDLGCMNISPAIGCKTPDDVTENTAFIPERVEDFFYAVKCAYPEFMEFGLKKIVKKLKYTKDLYAGIETKEAVKGFIRGAYISQQAYKYAALDVYALSLMWEDKKFQNVMKNNMSYKVDMMSQAYALIYQQNGLLLNRDMWEKGLTESKADVVTYTALLPAGFNPNSYKQVRAYLNITESDNAALVVYANSDKPLAKESEYIIKLKKAKKSVSYLTSINFNRMYTKFNAAGAISGRFTSSGGSLSDHFNAQQIPRVAQPMFNSNMDGTKVIGLDYSTLELRVAAALFGAKTMYSQFKEGRDLHKEMALLATGKELAPSDFPNLDGKGLVKAEHGDSRLHKYLTKGDRDDAKSINFGYVFGMSAKSYVPFAYVQYGVKVSLQEATDLRNTYFKLYPEIAALHDHIWKNYKKPTFFVETALGRRIKPKLGTDGINTPVQGTGAETTKLGVHYMVKENPLILKYIYNVVHDAVYARTPDELFSQYHDLIQRGMIKGWTEISKTKAFKFKDIPMIAE